MDRKIENRTKVWGRRVSAGLLVIAVVAGLYALASHFSVSRLEVDRDRLLIATVQRGKLQGEAGAAKDGESILLPRGAFFERTGGRWVYLVDEPAGGAVKHPVRLGAQDAEFFEVLAGLEPGDRVITSSYSHLGDVDRIVFKP